MQENESKEPVEAEDFTIDENENLSQESPPDVVEEVNEESDETEKL
jgi:hypothetical protein